MFISVENVFYHSIKDSKPPTTGINPQIHKYYNDLAELQRKFNNPPTTTTQPKKHCHCGTVWCGCDTDSCTDSNKCYCHSTTKSTNNNNSIFEQLKEKGIPCTPQQPKQHHKRCDSIATKSTKSLEYLRNENLAYYEQVKGRGKGNKGRPLEGKRCYSSDNLALDYELFTVEANAKRKLGGRKGSAASECGGFRSVFKATDSIRSYNSQRNYTTHHTSGK